jgi:hypothetical protein
MADLSIGSNSINPLQFSFGQPSQTQANAALVPNTTTTDSLSSSPSINVDVVVKTPQGTINITSSRMTIGMFADIIGQSLNNSHDALRRGDLADLFANSKLAGNQIAGNLIKIIRDSNLCQKIGNAEDALTNTDLQAMKDAIAQFNSSVAAGQSPPGEDATQIATLNQAINDYNAGTITQDQFNTAVQDYNTYAASRNGAISANIATYNAAVSTYTAAVAANNATIDSINADITTLNADLSPEQQVPLLPHQTVAVPDASFALLPTSQSSPPLTVPIPNVVGPSPLPDPLTLLPVPTIPTAKQLENTLISPSLQALLSQIGIYNNSVKVHEAISDYYIFTRKGNGSLNRVPLSKMPPPFSSMQQVPEGGSPTSH